MKRLLERLRNLSKIVINAHDYTLLNQYMSALFDLADQITEIHNAKIS
jgi:hypothetical protein